MRYCQSSKRCGPWLIRDDAAFRYPVHMQLLPAPANRGIVFKRLDLPGKPRYRPLWQISSQRIATTLGLGAAQVMTVEHLMAALRDGIDNTIVELNPGENSLGDGSSQVFVDMIKQAGVCLQGASPMP